MDPSATCLRRRPETPTESVGRRWGPRLTLRVRLALLMVVAVALVGVANQFYIDTRILSELEHELDLRGLSIARHLRAESVDLILRQDFVGLRELLSNAQANGFDFVYAFVMDPTDRVLAHTFDSNFPQGLKVLNRYREHDGYQIQRIKVFGEHFRDFALPVYHGELGVLRVGVSDMRILKRVGSVRRELLALLLGIMALSAATAYLLTYLGLRPLAAITAALERFEPGKHWEHVPVRRDDEVGDLARKVNEITARLHDSYKQMMQTEKMVAAGVMASGIAHEINNPISGLQNCLRRIQANPEDTRQTKEYAGVMLQATEHIETVVRGLLDFSRRTPRQIRVLDLRRPVRKAVYLSAFRLQKNRIDVQPAIPDDPVWVEGDETQLMQVVVNVVLNAVDAMPDGGALQLGIDFEKDHAVLCICDGGSGIAPESLPRVFEPFFTTKDAGKGTGLGLAVTHSIIHDHGGSIAIDSQPGQGTKVTIRLPLSAGNPKGGNEAA